MKDEDFGKVMVTGLTELIEKSGMSRNRICKMAYLENSQLRKLERNQMIRIDFITLAKLCYVLECKPEDFIRYIPPEK